MLGLFFFTEYIESLDNRKLRLGAYWHFGRQPKMSQGHWRLVEVQGI